jgi:hypothetical protein
VPSAPARLRGFAQAAGWDVTLTYARGFIPGRGAGAWTRVHSVAVRCRDTVRSRAAVVVYEAKADAVKISWTAQTCMVLGADHWPVSTGVGVEDVKTYLRESHSWDSGDIDRWAGGLSVKINDRKLAAKIKAAGRPKKAKVAS